MRSSYVAISSHDLTPTLISKPSKSNAISLSHTNMHVISIKLCSQQFLIIKLLITFIYIKKACITEEKGKSWDSGLLYLFIFDLKFWRENEGFRDVNYSNNQWQLNNLRHSFTQGEEERECDKAWPWYQEKQSHTLSLFHHQSSLTPYTKISS